MGAAVGMVAKVAMPIVMNVVAGAASNLIGNVLSSALGGAPKSGGADGIAQCLSPLNAAKEQLFNAAGNLLRQVVGEGIKMGIDFLCDKLGMPKFLGNALKQAVDQILEKQHQPCDPNVQNAVNNSVKEDANDQIKNIADQLLKQVQDILKGRTEKETTEGCDRAGNKGKISAKSWIAILAEALGKVQGAKMQEMIQLTNKVSDVADEQSTFHEKSKGMDVKDENKMHNYDTEKSKLAAEMTKAQTELQGVQQEYKLISETTSTFLKTLGEALSGMARKQ